MDITITGRKMSISDALHDYAEERIEHAAKVMKIEPLDIDVMLYREKSHSKEKAACCEITARSRGHIIRVEESDQDLHTAIDVAAAKLQRQMRKFKTRVYDKKYKATEPVEEPVEIDKIMDELTEDDVIVRVKEVEFLPMTEEEAIIQMDLLGHDFFVYIDRDTSIVCVLYRRNDGGYGLLKQAEQE